MCTLEVVIREAVLKSKVCPMHGDHGCGSEEICLIKEGEESKMKWRLRAKGHSETDGKESRESKRLCILDNC